MNNNDYIRLSLETHLFFDRIMKEHAFFLATSFTNKDKELNSLAIKFQKIFDDILTKIIYLLDGSSILNMINTLESITPYTLDSEKKTNELLGENINIDITLKEMNLKSGYNNIDINSIKKINQQTIMILRDFINFKKDVLSNVLDCKSFTSNYPSLINHIIEEADMYYKLLTMLEENMVVGSDFVYEQQVFWDEVMKEHAQFIRGLLDPYEQKKINGANQYAISYQRILDEKYPIRDLIDINLEQTNDFKLFKETLEKEMINCKIKSIMTPILVDHMLREANHFIKISQNYKQII